MHTSFRITITNANVIVIPKLLCNTNFVFLHSPKGFFYLLERDIIFEGSGDLLVGESLLMQFSPGISQNTSLGVESFMKHGTLLGKIESRALKLTLKFMGGNCSCTDRFY